MSSPPPARATVAPEVAAAALHTAASDADADVRAYARHATRPAGDSANAAPYRKEPVERRIH